MSGYRVVGQERTSAPKRIDYERMNREWPGQQARLREAVASGDPVRVAEETVAAVKAWDEIGAWPDDWAAYQRALDDVLPWNQAVDMEDVAYGRVRIERTR